MRSATGPGRTTVVVADDDARSRAAVVRALDDCPGLLAVGLSIDQALRLATGPLAADGAVVDLPVDDDAALELVRVLSRSITVLVTSLHASGRVRAGRAGATAYREKDGDDEALVTWILDHLPGSIHNGPRGVAGHGGDGEGDGDDRRQ